MSYTDEEIDLIISRLHSATAHIKDELINNAILDAMDIIDEIRISGYLEV
jgi:hypothetical protein